MESVGGVPTIWVLSNFNQKLEIVKLLCRWSSSG